MKNVLNTWIIVIFLTSYTKNKDICNEVSGGDIGFKVYEFVLDSIFQTDTSFINKDIFLKPTIIIQIFRGKSEKTQEILQLQMSI